MTTLPASCQGELQSWPRSEWIDGLFFGVRKLVVAWDDRVDMLNWLAAPGHDGWPYPDGPPALLRRAKILPLADERGGGAQLPPDSHFAKYDMAVIECHYSTRGPVYLGGRLIDESLVPTFEHILVNYQKLKWEDDTALVPDDAFGKLICGFDYIIKYYRLPLIPAWVLTHVGCVNANNVPAMTLDLTFPAGTLQYKYPTLTRSITLGRISGWDVTVRYGYRGTGWWKHWRAATGRYESVFYTDSGDQYYNYPGTNMVL